MCSTSSNGFAVYYSAHYAPVVYDKQPRAGPASLTRAQIRCNTRCNTNPSPTRPQALWHHGSAVLQHPRKFVLHLCHTFLEERANDGRGDNLAERNAPCPSLSEKTLIV